MQTAGVTLLHMTSDMRRQRLRAEAAAQAAQAREVRPSIHMLFRYLNLQRIDAFSRCTRAI